MAQKYNAWSIGTALRDPRRITPEVVTVLKDFETLDFNRNQENQKKLYTELVRRKLTRASNLSRSEEESFVDKDTYFSQSEAENFVERAEEESTAKAGFEPDKRARTFIKPFERVGLIKNVKNKKVVTKLGEQYLNKSIDLPDVILNFGLKWEIPNPGDKDFSQIENVNIKPFVGMLALIDMVNSKWAKDNKSVGLSSWETNIFTPTLVNFHQFEDVANNIISIRNAVRNLKNEAQKKEYQKTFQTNFIRENLFRNNENLNDVDIETAYRTLDDYTKNNIPFFKVTGFLETRGYNYTDITKSSLGQVKQLINNELFKPLNFSTYEDYMEYLTDLNSFVAPWKETSKETEIINSLDNLLNVTDEEYEAYLANQEIDLPVNTSNLLSDSVEISNRKTALKVKKAKNLQQSYLYPEKINELIENFENIFSVKNRAIRLEYLQFLSMLSINDFVKISPNFKTNDEFEITFYAPGNVPDMTIEYETFYLVSEVTMLENREQWYNEGVPVIRHIDDHKRKNPNKPTLGIFVAPSVHEDTLRTWFLEGKYQKTVVVPFSFEQWKSILEKYSTLRSQSENPTSDSFKEFLDTLIPNNEDNDFNDWETRIEKTINEFVQL